MNFLYLHSEHFLPLCELMPLLNPLLPASISLRDDNQMDDVEKNPTQITHPFHGPS